MSNLLFIPNSQSDYLKMESLINESDFYAESNSIESYFSFEDDNIDVLEMELTKLVTSAEINGHFEAEY